jgi:hypothetical protein
MDPERLLDHLHATTRARWQDAINRRETSSGYEWMDADARVDAYSKVLEDIDALRRCLPAKVNDERAKRYTAMVIGLVQQAMVK